MDAIASITETRRAVQAIQEGGGTVGFVPTMGALHVGHLSLIEAARNRCDAIVVSIFVNPTQFTPGEDYERYPKPIAGDLAACEAAGVDLVFCPEVADMCPPDSTTQVHVGRLTDGLCGAHRPGHFDGVTTIVAKLFNIVPADMAFFGEKDFQQLRVIQRMVRDLDLPIEIVPCPTVREPDGLAVSSRNAYLSADERRRALTLSSAMRSAIAAHAGGERDAAVLIELMTREIIAAGGIDIDYVSIVDAETLQDLDAVDRPARICVAARIGACRLIDNMPLGTQPPTN